MAQPPNKLKAPLFFLNPKKIEWPEISEPNPKRAIWRAQKLFAEIVYDVAHYEGNPFTLPEVQTLLEGITVGGHKISDAEQVLQQKNALEILLKKENRALSKTLACEFNLSAAKFEALEPGVFRTGKVGITGTQYQPPSHETLDKLFEDTCVVIQELENPFERAVSIFLSGCRAQFFWDGNKRTSRLLMNNILLEAGQDIITLPASVRLEFNARMIEFYESGDGTEVANLVSKHQIRSRFE